MSEGMPNPDRLDSEFSPDESLSLAELCKRLEKLLLMKIAKKEELALVKNQVEKEQRATELRKIERLYKDHARIFEVRFAGMKF